MLPQPGKSSERIRILFHGKVNLETFKGTPFVRNFLEIWEMGEVASGPRKVKAERNSHCEARAWPKPEQRGRMTVEAQGTQVGALGHGCCGSRHRPPHHSPRP